MDYPTIVSLYCPDCRGRFEVDYEDLKEDEVIECTLCGAEILVLQDNPPRIKLFTEDDDF